MSANSARMREKMRMRIPPAQDQADDDNEIEWLPDWGRCCELCGQTPCMVGLSGGTIVIEAARCADCLERGEPPDTSRQRFLAGSQGLA